MSSVVAAPFTLIALYGVTGVGKTATALRLAQELGCVIISSDSRQCYREMRIGTAQPTAAERAQVPHYFVATHSITERFSAGQFEVEALSVIESLKAAGVGCVPCSRSGVASASFATVGSRRGCVTFCTIAENRPCHRWSYRSAEWCEGAPRFGSDATDRDAL